MSWDDYFINLAFVVAQKSKDPSTKVGAVIVGKANNILSTGYNGFCRGADDNNQALWERPEKYFWVAHAESNAVYNAARHGVALENSKIYVTGCPCMECAKAIVQSGIAEVRFTYRGFSEDAIQRWEENSKRSIRLFSDCHVNLIELP